MHKVVLLKVAQAFARLIGKLEELKEVGLFFGIADFRAHWVLPGHHGPQGSKRILYSDSTPLKTPGSHTFLFLMNALGPTWALRVKVNTRFGFYRFENSGTHFLGHFW